MLTFFEYLRQRAFESVLAGAQEALDYLERQQALAEQKKQLPVASQQAADRPPKPPRKREDQRVSSESKPGDRTADDEPLLDNYGRGRPTNHAQGKR